MTGVTEDRGQAGAGGRRPMNDCCASLPSGPAGRPAADRRGGLLAKMEVEDALEGELDDHLSYDRHDPESRDGGNSRNWHRAKTVLTEARPTEISVLRDRDS
jgi:hypothetical protein